MSGRAPVGVFTALSVISFAGLLALMALFLLGPISITRPHRRLFVKALLVLAATTTFAAALGGVGA